MASVPCVTLYGRPGCHLCEVMERLLAPLAVELAVAVEHVDVETDPDLERRYGDRVPVLVDAQGQEICHATLDADAFRCRVAVK